MKKIIFIVCLLVTSLGYTQVLLEDFEGPTFPALAAGNGAPPPVIMPDPVGVNGDVLSVVTNAAGQPWQQSELILQTGSELDLTGTDKRVSVDWYSVAPFDALLKVELGGPASATEAAHLGGGWRTLVFDFNNSEDCIGVANGVYQRLIFFNLWDIDAPRGCNSDGDGWFIGSPNASGSVASTTYVDNITKGVIAGTTWTGNTNTDWDTPTNWDNGVPTAVDLVTIPNVANMPTASGPAVFSEMLIESGASFIANATVLGTITYERNLSSSDWHSVSSPVIGQDEDDFVLASGFKTQGTDVGFCTFDTDLNYWDFYQSGTNTAATLGVGEGYIVNLLAASGDISFTGTMNLTDVSIPLPVITTGNGYHLLGNPYTSYIDSGAMLTTSTAALLSETIWVWDQSTDSYETKVAVDNFQLAPGQGFFVQSNGAPGTVTINEAFQSHQGTDTFLRSDNRTEVYLTLSDGSRVKKCKVYYIDGTTTGFDNGYDGFMFRAFPEPFSIYTHLITNGFNRDIGVQSLPNDDYENLVVPVGVNAASGIEFTISADAINLPTGIDLYIEDRGASTFTLLNPNSDFTLTPTNDLNGAGRFYLHTTSNVLGINDNALAYDLQIYTTGSSKELMVKGQLSGITTADLYNIEGKLVLSKTLEQFSTSNTLDISGLSSGVYVVKVDNANQSKTQKVIIK